MRFRTRLYVDFKLLAENYEMLRKLCPNNQVLFMIKANAYGHGMVPLVRFAVLELGVKEFGCATLGEARKLRDELPDLEFEIYVFSDIHLEFQSCSDFYLNRRIIPVVSNMHDLDYILDNKRFVHFPLSIKFNTSMNRLGFNIDDTQQIVDKLKKNNRFSIYHLLSHLASASGPVTPDSKNAKQYENFCKIKKFFIDSGIEVERTSLANSGAIEQQLSLDLTHIRPGLILYGPSSLSKPYRDLSQWKGKTISTLETYVISTFPVKKGQEIGYGAIPSPYDGLVVLIAIGYGDGFSTGLYGPELYHNGCVGKVLGRTNMDMTQVIFHKDQIPQINSGDKFVIWGHNPSDILNFSDGSNAIAYEYFCHLTSRVPRIYSL